MAFVLLCYAAIWTLYGTLATGSQDIHFDMSELVAWSRQPALGYAKHPPFAAWVVKAWFSLFPLANWSYYLLAMVTSALALWIAWRVSAEYLGAKNRVLAVALLTLVPFFNFHALKFNVNTMLLPLWAVTTLAFLRSYERRSVSWGALAGAAAAAAMLGKYWSVILVLGLVLAAVLDSRRGAYFRSPVPWVTVLVGAVTIAPHLYWLVTHHFAPFSYAVAAHDQASPAAKVLSSFSYLTGAAAYVVLPVALTLAASRPDRAALRDMVWPAEPRRQLLALAFWAPLLLPLLAPLAADIAITSLWTMSAWTLLGVMLLSPSAVTVSRRSAMRIFAFACIFPFVMTATAPAIAMVIQRWGVAPSAAHASLLAKPLQRFWNQTTRRPLRLVGGDLSYQIAFYLAGEPLGLTSIDPSVASGIDRSRIARDGLAIVCNAADSPCVSRANALAAGNSSARRTEVTIVRRFAGIAGPAARYLIVALPPQRGSLNSDSGRAYKSR